MLHSIKVWNAPEIPPHSSAGIAVELYSQYWYAYHLMKSGRTTAKNLNRGESQFSSTIKNLPSKTSLGNAIGG